MEKFYITTSIAYVNSAPHIGFALELVQADVVARYQRWQGKEVFFLTGTDEHGVKIVKAAAEQGKTPQELADDNSAKFQALKQALNLSWDDFIRTTDQKRHWPNVIDLWNKLVAAGDIYKKKYRGLYCIGHEAFVTEKDLVDGKCRDHNKEPEVIEEENWFFRLSKYGEEIKKKIKSGELKIYPESRANEILSFIKEGAEDISFSRPRKDLQWGIPVPGDETQTIYVWADALSNYLYPNKANWWPADLHVIGKDILRFHALFWPGMLLSVGLPLPRAIFVHGFITANGQKMSKTLGNVINPFELTKKYGADPVRYYLLREIPTFNDGDFSYEKFEQRYNADLANGIGNYAARVAALAKKYDVITRNEVTACHTAAGEQSSFSRHCEDIPSFHSEQAPQSIDLEVKNFIQLTEKTVACKMEDYKLSETLELILELVRFGDGYVNKNKPWESGDKKIIISALAILDAVGKLLEPFLPETAEKIFTGGVTKLFPRLS